MIWCLKAHLPSTYEVGPINKFSLEVSVTLESKMEESAKLVLPEVDVSTLLSAIVYTLLSSLGGKKLNKHTWNKHDRGTKQV